MRRSVPPLLLAALIAACSAERARDKPDSFAARTTALAAFGIHARSPELAIDEAISAAAFTRVTDPTGAVSIAFALEGASDAPGESRNGVTLFASAASALGGADVVHSTRADGIEDFVFFDERPAREEIAYVVDVTRVAGLRVVDGTLEMLDDGGAPRLRVARPWIAEADGARRNADLSVEGCAFDASSSAPWGRAVVAPGARSCVVRVAWSASRYPIVVDPAWTSTGSLAASRYQHAMVTLASGKFFVIGGFHNPGSLGTGPTLSGELFDPATRTWGAASSIPNGRQDLAVALMANGKYLITGGGGSSRMELYDPTTNGISRSMNGTTTYSGLSATSLPSGRVLIAGGTNGTSQTATTLYDYTIDDFAAAGPLGTARAYHTATTLASGKILFVGGNGTSGALASAELYDPVANTFAPTGSMAHARATHVAVLLGDGRVFVTGGGDASGEIYDPVAGTFSTAGTMSSDRTSSQAVLLQSGHVLVAGGSAATPLATVDVFDPTTRSFASTSPLAVARTLFSAGLLATGEAVVVGGKATSGLSLDSTEVLKPGAAGTACVAKDDCASGACEEGICCAMSTCGGACKTCVQGTGACVAVMSMDDLDSCTGATTCDAAGACKKKNGQTCTATTDCASGFCVDGFCCDKACSGQCEACDVAAKPGTCSAVIGDSHGARAKCASFGAACGGTCNGITVAQCAFASAVTTCSSACTNAIVTESLCDGVGGCVPDAPHACSGNYACADAKLCKTTCATDVDCAKNYHCSAGKCLPTAVCDGSIVRQPDKTIDCAPYTCEQSGACRNTCSVVTDCVAPNVCSLGGECVAPSLPEDASGCTIGRRGDRSTWLVVAAGALGAMIARRRRRSAR